MHVQSCCFAKLNPLFFYSSRCRRCGRCLSSLESLKDFGNSAFLQKGQLCYLKRAEISSSRFCIYFSQNKMQNCYLFCQCQSIRRKVKKGRYCQLSSENILMSIFFNFHPFLTLANKVLQREKVNFFRLQTISLKARKS